MAADLILAHRLERSYSAQIAYETTLNQHQHGVAQLRALADAGAPAGVDASPDDWAAGVERVHYGSALFVGQTQSSARRSRNPPTILPSPAAPPTCDRSCPNPRRWCARCNRPSDARRAGNLPVFKAASLAADRNLSHLHTILGNISQNISNTKNEMLDQEADRVRETRINLISLTIIGVFLVAPVTAYARGLSEQIAAFDAELQAERDALEQRVQERTAQLRTEIGERIRLEEFNRSENRILEMVAEGALLANILSELALAVEAFCPASRCLISSSAGQADPLIAPSFPRPEIAALTQLLAEPAGAAFLARSQNRPVFLSGLEQKLAGRRSVGPHRAISVRILVVGALR